MKLSDEKLLELAESHHDFFSCSDDECHYEDKNGEFCQLPGHAAMYLWYDPLDIPACVSLPWLCKKHFVKYLRESGYAEELQGDLACALS